MSLLREVEEILIECTETRDQPKNKERALSRLRTYIYDREHQKYIDDIASRRKSLVSTGDRSAKIRTYNFPQGRVTDHRIGFTTHDLAGFLGGNIQPMIDALTVAENGSPTGDFQTSRDGGNTWTDYTIDTAITLNTGDEVSFRTSADRTSEQTSQDYFGFQMTGKIEAHHNVMSLYRTNDFATYNTVVNYAFKAMFLNCTSLTKAPVLPATTLATSCYYSMFFGCSSLTKAPKLPDAPLLLLGRRG